MAVSFAARGPIPISGAGGTAPILDGVGKGNVANNTIVESALTALTTTQINNIIVAIIMSSRTVAQGSASTISVMSDDTIGGPLGWAKRKQVSFQNAATGTDYIDLEIWWALSAATLSGRTISATFGATCDDAAIIVFGVNGCGNLIAPWDVNGSLSVTGNNGTSSAPTLSGVSTTAPGTLLIMCSGTANEGANNSDQTVGNAGVTPFATVENQLANSGSAFSKVSVETLGITSAQSSITTTFGANWNGWIAITDALVGT